MEFKIIDKPSNSKGWARYRAESNGSKIIESRTGNQWVSSNKSCKLEDGVKFEVEMDVMLRVGKGRTAREKRGSQKFAMVAKSGSVEILEFYPGSQGMRLEIQGAFLNE